MITPLCCLNAERQTILVSSLRKLIKEKEEITREDLMELREHSVKVAWERKKETKRKKSVNEPVKAVHYMRPTKASE
jgi:hypothetical protein